MLTDDATTQSKSEDVKKAVPEKKTTRGVRRTRRTQVATPKETKSVSKEEAKGTNEAHAELVLLRNNIATLEMSNKKFQEEKEELVNELQNLEALLNKKEEESINKDDDEEIAALRASLKDMEEKCKNEVKAMQSELEASQLVRVLRL